MKKLLRTAQNYFPNGRDRREAMSRGLQRLRGRPHDPDFLALKYLPPGQVLLDIGANYGQSITSMLLMRPDCKIHSFEPNTELAGKITTLFAPDRRVVVHPFGLSNVSGTFDLFVPYYRDFPYPGLASLYESEARSWLSSETLYFFRATDLLVKRVRCQVETLDSLSLCPYFIKIDVQGSEFEVISGSQATLAKRHPMLLIESPERDRRIGSLLGSWGYLEFEYAEGAFRKPRSEGVNTFFITDAMRTDLDQRYPGLFVC